MTEITWDTLDLFERAALKIVPDEWTDANDLPGIAFRLIAAMHRVHNKGLLELKTRPGMKRLWRRSSAGRALVQAADGWHAPKGDQRYEAVANHAMDVFDELARVTAERDALKAENAALKAALKPFAEVGDDYADFILDETKFRNERDGWLDWFPRNVSMKHLFDLCQAAARALKAEDTDGA